MAPEAQRSTFESLADFLRPSVRNGEPPSANLDFLPSIALDASRESKQLPELLARVASVTERFRTSLNELRSTIIPSGNCTAWMTSV